MWQDIQSRELATAPEGLSCERRARAGIEDRAREDTERCKTQDTDMLHMRQGVWISKSRDTHQGVQAEVGHRAAEETCPLEEAVPRAAQRV